MTFGFRARCAAVLMLGTLALYARTWTFEFVWDDRYQITENRSVTEGAPAARYFLDSSTTTSRPDFNSRIYRPLRNLVFRGLAKAFGYRP